MSAKRCEWGNTSWSSLLPILQLDVRDRAVVICCCWMWYCCCHMNLAWKLFSGKSVGAKPSARVVLKKRFIQNIRCIWSNQPSDRDCLFQNIRVEFGQHGLGGGPVCDTDSQRQCLLQRCSKRCLWHPHAWTRWQPPRQQQLSLHSEIGDYLREQWLYFGCDIRGQRKF